MIVAPVDGLRQNNRRASRYARKRRHRENSVVAQKLEPERVQSKAAAADLRQCRGIVVKAQARRTCVIPTGIAIAVLDPGNIDREAALDIGE